MYFLKASIMNSLKCIIAFLLLIVQTDALPPCSFKRGIGVLMTCDVSRQNVTSLQWQVGGMRSEVNPHLTTCDLHGCDKQSYEGTHTFVATVQLDPTSTRIVTSSVRLSGDPFFSYFIGDYDCVPDGGQAIRICDDLSYFDDPTPPVCGPPVVADDDVQLSCTIENVYPDPQCRINISSNGHARNITTAIIEESSQMKVNPDYMSFSASCNVSIPLRDLGVGDHVFQLVASANFNDTELAQVYSNNVSLIISTVPQKPTCVYPWVTNEDIFVECYTSYVYPALRCEMEALKDKNPILLPANVTFSNDVTLYQAKTVPVSKCIFSIPLYHLGPGSFEFKVTMYNANNATNGTGTMGDLTKPLVLKNPTLKNLSRLCPDHVKIEPSQKVVTCTCKFGEVGNPHGSVEWHTSTGKVVTGDFVMAFVDDIKANRTYTCIPRTPLSDNLPGYTWAPIWPDHPIVANFTANGQETLFEADLDTSVTLDCRTGGTPLPRMVITEEGSEIIVPTNGTSASLKITECTDSTRYTCQALNASGTAVDSRTLDVMVKCPIQLANTSALPIIVTSNSSKNVEIYLKLTGYPKPTNFFLYMSKGDISGPLMYPEDFSVKSNVTDKRIINMALTVRDVSDTASYRFRVGNDVGQLLGVNFTISIRTDTKDESSHLNKRALAGGIAGGVLAIALVVFLSALLRHRKTICSNTANSEDRIPISSEITGQSIG